MNPYETRKLVDEYLLFHYGADHEILPWECGPTGALQFPVRTVAETFDWTGLPPESRALDVGCAVGRSALELSRHCAEVIGIDFSQAFVDAAETMRTAGRLDYQSLEEAGLFASRTALRPDGVMPDRVRFARGDAMALDPGLGAFDLVHAANLLCRLPEPIRFLEQLPGLVRSGGQLVLTTPCTWLEEFTPKEHWPVGSTFDWLQARLSDSFTLLQSQEMPFLIREHRRKFQWTVAQASVWERI
jgi:putative 4-mercaptohistidine N1-methyltranferase